MMFSNLATRETHMCTESCTQGTHMFSILPACSRNTLMHAFFVSCVCICNACRVHVRFVSNSYRVRVTRVHRLSCSWFVSYDQYILNVNPYVCTYIMLTDMRMCIYGRFSMYVCIIIHICKTKKLPVCLSHS